MRQLLCKRLTRRSLLSTCMNMYLLKKPTLSILSLKFQRHLFPFTYFGFPIFYSTRKKDFDKGIIFKVHERLQSQKGKLLFIWGREVLIAHVLESMPIHLLSDVNPLTYVIAELHTMFARFYWSNSGNRKARYWASWIHYVFLRLKVA